MKYSLLTLVSLCLCVSLFGQNLWKESSLKKNNIPLKQRITQPSKFRTISLDINLFKELTQDVPLRTDNQVNKKDVVLEFPMPNGKLERFRLVDAELMHPDLAAKFPELKSYIGKGIDDATADLRITYSPYHGFNGMIRSGKHSTVYIDPLTMDNKDYMVYYRKDVKKTDEGFQCHTQHADSSNKVDEENINNAGPNGDCNLRRYRLAQSCTGEYAQYHIAQAGGTTGTTAGDKAIVQSAMNVTMARVNGVYEIDLGITMQMIANNDQVIYLNGGTDPWTNEWNTKTAETLDAVIGVNNYDIGHNFNTTGGGNAGCLTCVCSSVNQGGTHKGRGYTGRAAPVGDPFDIDYVAHEMGHQFGGYHTQSNNSCRSGSGSTEVEPGSASTIMGYAGICAANVQGQSDDYFHYVNIRDIVNAINNGSENVCAELISSGNSGPSSDAGSNYIIPASTPFLLTGIASDPDDAGLTYCWEQNDPENNGVNTAPQDTWTVGPMFRSFDPVAVPYRYFPKLDDIINNVTPTWEVLPSVSRDMEFAFTVRDNNTNSGCTSYDLMSVTTVATAGPFLVTNPNTGLTWNAGDTETVTWDVAGTTAAPINCATVDIYLSTDGGLTYPGIIAKDVANDGSEMITVPAGVPGTNNRIQIRCSDNIFFDISNTDFTILSTGPAVNFSSSAASSYTEGTSCNTKDISFSLSLDSAPNADTDVTLGLSGSATLGTDYTINSSVFTFTTANWNIAQTVILTVKEDAIVEGTENIIVNIANVTGSNALRGVEGFLCFTFMDDDVALADAGPISTIYSNTFASTAGLTLNASNSQVWVHTTGTPANWGTYVSGPPGFTTIANGYMMFDSDGYGNGPSEDATFSFNTDCSGVTDIMLKFEQHYCNYQNDITTITVDNGTTSQVYTLNDGLSENGCTTQPENIALDISAIADGQASVDITFRYQGSNDYWWLVDDLVVEGRSPAVIQEAVNVVSGYAEHDLGAGAIVHFFDQATGNIMCTIDNSASSHDYGCTRVEVDRQGTGSVGFVNTDVTTYLFSKSYKITPTTNTTSDPNGYTITMYYTDAEVTGWEGATTESRNNAFIHKVNGANAISDVTAGNPSSIPISSQAATYVAFGNTDHTFSATFTNGFSGFGVGISASPLPIELLSFKGEYVEGKGNVLDWTTATEENSAYFEVEHSFDSKSFEMIEIVEAAGHSAIKQDYEFTHENPRAGMNYYRLKMVDLDGTFEYSDVIYINREENIKEITMFPNPTKGNLYINISHQQSDFKDDVQVELFDMSGRLLKNENYLLDSVSQITFEMDDVANGTYFIRIISGNIAYSEKVVKL